jgi:hypothetical protein
MRLTEREQKENRLPEDYEYRLPTEAEWEYASRAGTDKEFVVPVEELAYGYRHLVEVGTTPANPLGLYEVLGNVAEWCLDQWREYPKNQESTTVDRFHEGNPSQAMFIVRGHGFWYTDLPPTVFVRAPRHDIAGGFRGFRVVLGPAIPLAELERERAQRPRIDDGTCPEIVGIEETGESGAASLGVPDETAGIFLAARDRDADTAGVDLVVPVEGIFQRNGAEVGMIPGGETGDVLHPLRRPHLLVGTE